MDGYVGNPVQPVIRNHADKCATDEQARKKDEPGCLARHGRWWNARKGERRRMKGSTANTLLHYAQLGFGHFDFVQILCNNGARMRKQSYKALKKGGTCSDIQR
nr:PREDICTED: uncharacterized protein LOC105662002 [Megachile rotundata]XP_012136774.1 PREDICTED: uncharacterized protein LOC105662002 [Megachile rotundata]